jgi:hypothetical protein
MEKEILEKLAKQFREYIKERESLDEERQALIVIIKAIAIENNNKITYSAKSLAIAKNFQIKECNNDGFISTITVEEKCQS